MKKNVASKRQKICISILGSLFGLLFLFGATVIGICIWYRVSFQMAFKELLFTFFSPLKGTGQSTVDQILEVCLPIVLCVLLAYIVLLIFLVRHSERFVLFRRIGAGVCVATFLFSLVFAFFSLGIPEYLEVLGEQTTIYEDYYVDPETAEITSPGKPKNLIYICLESMETTYASQKDGGNQPFNYMPNLTAMAGENLAFSDCELLGGFHSPSGTAWTMGALLAMTSGVPFSLEVFGEESHNSMIYYESFAPGLTTLGDVLEKQGYKQEFLCGSDAAFAGRDTYFKQHGGYEIFDLYTAREKGYIDEDYYVWWGYEDAILFEIAKDEVTRLASSDQPFNFTMLTVDAHHVNGYRCDRCGNQFTNRLANIIACTDSLVFNFVEWCKHQDFYEDTVIVIAGDHPRMDSTLVKGVDLYDRTMYNCILNADVDLQSKTQNRVFTTFDMFPTTLAAMGFEIKGDRLGLGTNLFSPLPTLAEEKGYDWLDAEISKYSTYYAKHFS